MLNGEESSCAPISFLFYLQNINIKYLGIEKTSQGRGRYTKWLQIDNNVILISYNYNMFVTDSRSNVAHSPLCTGGNWDFSDSSGLSLYWLRLSTSLTNVTVILKQKIFVLLILRKQHHGVMSIIDTIKIKTNVLNN